MILGLTGSFGSGCSAIAQFLSTDVGFVAISLSDRVKNEVSKAMGSGTPETLKGPERRRLLQDTGDELRKVKGPHYLVDCILDDIKDHKKGGKDVVVDSIRNSKEVMRLRQSFADFWLIAVDASRDTRWKRCKKDYEGDQGRFDEDDARDTGDSEPDYGQKVQECVHSADIVLSNDSHCRHPSDWDVLFRKVEGYLRLIRNPGFRTPFPAESFMAQACVASLSSSCTRRQVGAILVSMNNSEIISSGFNDVPGGEQKCRELGGDNYCYRREALRSAMQRMKYWPCCGNRVSEEAKVAIPWICPVCKMRLPDDFVPTRMLDLCRALHAEEDAILQAAKLGSVSLKNCILYTTTFPCALCAKMIVDVGITTVIYVEPYPMPEAVDILQNAEPCVILQKYEGVQGRAFYELFKPGNT